VYDGAEEGPFGGLAAAGAPVRPGAGRPGHPAHGPRSRGGEPGEAGGVIGFRPRPCLAGVSHHPWRLAWGPVVSACGRLEVMCRQGNYPAGRPGAVGLVLVTTAPARDAFGEWRQRGGVQAAPGGQHGHEETSRSPQRRGCTDRVKELTEYRRGRRRRIIVVAATQTDSPALRVVDVGEERPCGRGDLGGARCWLNNVPVAERSCGWHRPTVVGSRCCASCCCKPAQSRGAIVDRLSWRILTLAVQPRSVCI